MAQWYYDDEPLSEARPKQFGATPSSPLLPDAAARRWTTAPPPPPREEVIRRRPDSEPVAAARYGMAEVDSATTGLLDLAAQGADWLVGDDPVTGIENPSLQFFTPQASAERRESVWNVPPGYEPSGAFEQMINIGTQGLGTTATGGGGLGLFRALPALAKGGLRAYGKGLTDDYARNAAGLLASNTAGAAASEGLRQLEVDSLPLEIASSVASGMLGDFGARKAVRRIQGRGGREQTRDAASAMDDSVKPVDTPLNIGPNAPIGELVDRLRQVFRTRIADGAYSRKDLFENRNRQMDALLQRRELITDDDIQNTLQTKGYQEAEALRRQKLVQDDILAEIQFFADLYAEGRPVPSLYGILAGAGLDNVDLAAMTRLRATGALGREADTRNLLALEDAARRAQDLAPDADGTPRSVRDAAMDAQQVARETAQAPYQGSGGQQSRVVQILSGDGRIDPDAIRVDAERFRSVIDRVRDREEFGPAYTRVLRPFYSELEDALSAPGFLDPDGKISLVDFEQLRSRLQGLANANNTDEQLAAFIGPVIDRMDRMIARRIRHRDPALHDELLSYRDQYATMKRTYEPSGGSSLPTGEEDIVRALEKGVAKVLTVPQSSADEAGSLLSTARRLDKLAGDFGPEEVADQVRVYMADDPQRIAEVEASILNRLIESVTDPDSTTRRVSKAQEVVSGPSFSDEEGRMVALYRALAGDEKADALPDLLRIARAARADPTFKGGQAFGTGSTLTAKMTAAEKAVEGAEAVVDAATGIGPRQIFQLVRYGMGRFSPNIDERRLAAAGLAAEKDPNVLLQLLQAPSQKAYEDWQNRFLPRAGRTTGREGGKAFGRKNQKD